LDHLIDPIDILSVLEVAPSLRVSSRPALAAEQLVVLVLLWIPTRWSRCSRAAQQKQVSFCEQSVTELPRSRLRQSKSSCGVAGVSKRYGNFWSLP